MDTAFLFPLSIIFLLVLASGFFSSAETGITGASKAKIYKLKTSGNKKARMVNRLHEDKDRLIATILLGNNAVNILASAMATSMAITYFGGEGVAYATIIMTLMILIFAEIIPKTYALYHSEKVALNVAPILIFLIKLLSPITYSIQFIVDIIMNIFGIKKASSVMSSADELRGAIELSHQEGSVVKGEKEMLGSILDLSETEIGEIMVHRKNMVSIDCTDPIAEIVTFAMENVYTRLPIYKDKPENIIGILHVKDLLKEIQHNNGNIDDLNIEEIAADPWFVPKSNTLSNQLFQFRQKRNHLALVIDEYGDLTGLVTLEDILEEIVGQIYDEHDVDVQGIRKLKDGSYQIDGDVSIRDINRQLDWELPDEEASTVAGFIMYKAENIPDTGQEYEFEGYNFHILKKKKNQITCVKAKKL